MRVVSLRALAPERQLDLRRTPFWFAKPQHIISNENFQNRVISTRSKIGTNLCQGRVGRDVFVGSGPSWLVHSRPSLFPTYIEVPGVPTQDCFMWVVYHVQSYWRFYVTLTDVDKVAWLDVENRDDEKIVAYHHRRRRQLVPSMRCSTTYCFLAFSTSCAIASPYLKYRQLAACADPEAPLLKPCWDVLDIPSYLSEWQKNVAVCPELEYTNGCCILGEPWSSCFLRLGWEKAPSGCLGVSETDLGACQFPTGTVRSDIPRDTVQQVKYVTANIVNVHGLFQSLYKCESITFFLKG